jgi:hypothetical protein
MRSSIDFSPRWHMRSVCHVPLDRTVTLWVRQVPTFN